MSTAFPSAAMLLYSLAGSLLSVNPFCQKDERDPTGKAVASQEFSVHHHLSAFQSALFNKAHVAVERQHWFWCLTVLIVGQGASSEAGQTSFTHTLCWAKGIIW